MHTTALNTHLSVNMVVVFIAFLGISIFWRSKATWAFVPLLELGFIPNSKQILTMIEIGLIRRSWILILTASLSAMDFLKLLCMDHQPKNMSILSCCIASRHSYLKYSDTPVTNLPISSLLLAKIEKASFQRLTNLKEYSLINITPYRKFMNSSTLDYLYSVVKNLSMNEVGERPNWQGHP